MDKVQKEIVSRLLPVYQNVLMSCSFSGLCEIRFRVGQPIILYYNNRMVYLSKFGGVTNVMDDALFPSQKDIASMIHIFCKGSVYAYQEEIKGGFITVCGGHRIGISGRAVLENGKLIYIDSFSGINIRIAREYPCCADACIPSILFQNRILNTILISPPGVGKTTFLRDIARQLSSQYKVVIVDERSELAACLQGVPQFDIGVQTDVLDAFPKAVGIIHAMRSLSPDVIITDEIGTKEDLAAITELLKGGCKIVTSMHGYSIEEAITKKEALMKLFDTAILLEKKNGVVEVRKCLNLWESV